MGDKTQLLSLVLAARFRKPWPIAMGILVATLVNHGLAGAVGSWVTTALGPDVLRWVLGVSFIAMAATKWRLCVMLPMTPSGHKGWRAAPVPTSPPAMPSSASAW